MGYNKSLTIGPLPNILTQKRSAPLAGLMLGDDNKPKSMLYSFCGATYKLAPCAFVLITHVNGCLDQVRGVFSILPYVSPIWLRQDPHNFHEVYM